MKLIKPSVEYIPQPEGSNINNILQHIDKCARVCYKSENKFDENKSYDFIQKLIKSKHLAMLEHGTVYLREIRVKGADFDLQKYYNNPYSEAHTFYNADYPETLEIVVTTNYRYIVENKWLDDLKYLCQPTENHKKRYTLKFITDMGVCRELLRHRKFSFANESTRYCNYSKEKFGNEITFVVPYWYTHGNGSNDRECSMDSEFENCCRDSEQSYLRMIQWGAKPEEARQVLPLATKTELIMTGFKEDWDHFFSLRYYGTTGKPHPDMQYIAKLAFDELESKSDYRYPRDEFCEGVTGTLFSKD